MLKIPVIHVDQHIWNENWNETEQGKAEASLLKELNNCEWIVEGWITPCTELRFQQADIILYLDYSGLNAAIGGLKRWWIFRGCKRPEMPSGCLEGKAIDWHYLWIMFCRFERNQIEIALQNIESPTKLIRLKSPKKTSRFVKDFL